jgi:hypothetical protein
MRQASTPGSERRRRQAAWRGAALVLMAVGGAAADGVVRGEDADAAAARMAERDARGLGWLIERGLKAVERHEENELARINPGQRVQIEQQANQLEKAFQPILASELEMIRLSCGSLDTTARRQILAAGQKLVKQTALRFAERQLTGRLGREGFDPRQEIREGLEAVVRSVAGADELAAYEREQAERRGRRAAAARLRIVAKLDHQLDLSASQRRAIEQDLERRWEADWLGVLSETGGQINNYPPAPDYAAAAIEPHLAAEQRTAWEAWSRLAGARIMGQRQNWSLDGQGLQALDPWWTR